MTNYNTIFNSFPTFETPNLLLRELNIRDVEELFYISNQVDYMKEFFPPDMVMTKQNAFDSITIKYPEDFQNKMGFSWAIVLKRNMNVIGIRDVFIDSPHDPVVTQGYIKTDYRNYGYNQEVLLKLIEFLKFAESKQLDFNCSIFNNTVIHIAEKLGFTDISTPQMLTVRGRRKFRLSL